MPVARSIAVADAVAADLGAAAFSQPRTAERLYVPRFEPADLTNVRLAVVIAEKSAERSSRSQFERDVTLEVWILKRIAAEGGAQEKAELDALQYLAEEVELFYETRRPTGCAEALVSKATVITYDPDHLERKRVFAGLVSLVFRAWS